MQLEVVLARWRTCRDPQLSQLIVKLGGEPDPVVTAPFADLKATALVTAICGELAAQRSERVASLLPVIDRLVRTTRGSWPVIELLAELPADPRFAHLALKLLANFGMLTHTSAKLWRRLLDMVEHHGDPSCIEPLGAIDPREPIESTRARISNIAKRLTKATVLTADELAELRTAQLAPVSTNGDELLAAIYADPSSDDARTIYADWLTSQGDPRGEFIQLQLQRAAGKATPAGERREAALLKKYAKAWLGPLAPVIETPSYIADYVALPTELVVPSATFRRVSFARGFVRHVPTLEVPRHREAVLDDPIWATVEHVETIDSLRPTMRAIRTVDIGHLEMLADSRVFDRMGLAPATTLDGIAKCRVRHLELFVDSANASLVPELIARATYDNPILTEITLKSGAPRQWELLWDFRKLDLRYITRVTIETNPGRLEISQRGNHLSIDPSYGDTQHWSWILKPMKPFESVTIEPGRAADEVEYLVRQFELAPNITRL